MPDYGSNMAHVDQPLTNMSVAFFQSNEAFIADKVFPQVNVQRQSDIYYEYDTGDFTRDEAKLRGQFSESAGGDYDVDRKAYLCQKYAFHKDVSPEEVSNTDDPLDAYRDSTIYVTKKMLIRREVDWARKFFTTGKWGTEYTGVAASPGANQKLQWDQPNSTPIEDIDNAVVAMAEQTGFKPNTLVISPYVLTVLKNHFDILDRIKYTERGIVTEQLLASLFNVERVFIPWGVFNDAVKGTPDDLKFINGKNALLCYSNRSQPSLRSASAGYIFAWTGLERSGAYGNRIIRLPMDLLGLGTVRIEGEIAFDSKIIAPSLGVFFNNIVA